MKESADFSAKVVGTIFYLMLEHHLGKTKHGSMIGLIQNTVKAVMPSGGSMNMELKLLIQLVFDVLKLGEDAAAKKNFMLLLPEVWSIVSEIPGIVQNWGDLQAEMAALPGSQQESDLIAFIQQKFKDAGAPDKAQNILACALKLIQDTSLDALDLVAAIKK